MKTTTKLLSSLVLASTLATGAFAANNQPATTPAPKADINQVSYIIGYQLGDGFAKQNIQINSDQLIAGLKAGQTGATPSMTQQQMQDVMVAFQQQMMQQAQQQMQQTGAANLKASNDFMAAVAKMPNVKKVADGVFVQYIKKGDGQVPQDTSTVSVNYTGTTPAQAFTQNQNTDAMQKGELLGQVFDQSQTGNPVSFPLNAVIPCWTQALATVPVGSTVILYCAPSTAYGEMAPPQIGPNQALTFKVDILSIKK